MRIIQDSEGEDDLELEAAEAIRPDGNATSEHISSSTSPRLGEKGTGSTESLKRAIVAAHRAQFRDDSSDRPGQGDQSGVPPAADASASSKSQDAPQSSISLPGHASKRRRTSLDGAVALGSARDVLPATLDERHNEQLNTNNHLGIVPERPWDFQGTMREVWEHHEPMGLFAQTVSSTIPNATATQEQLLAEVLAPGFLGVEPEPDPTAARYEPAKSSVPWSEYLKSSSRAPEGRSQSAVHLSSFSQNNACSPATNLVGTPIYNEPRAESPDPLHPGPVGQAFSVEVTSGEAELQSTAPNTITSPGNTEQKSASVPNSEDDIVPIGVSLERYRPRPSRSRSLKLNLEESIDYSQRPERFTKKTRRTRTTGEVDTTSSATTPEKVRQICDMGFTPLTTKKALRQHNGDVSHTIDWLIANGLSTEDNMGPEKPERSKNTRESKRVEDTHHVPTDMHYGQSAETRVQISNAAVDPSTIAIEEDVSESACITSVRGSATAVRVVIPMKPTTLSKDVEHQSIAPIDSDHVYDEETAKHQNMSEPPELQSEQQGIVVKEPQKKKKRGRPRKEAKPIESITEEPEAKTSKPDTAVIAPDEQLEDYTQKPDKPESPAPTEAVPNERQSSGANANRDTKIDQVTLELQPPPEKKVKQTIESPSSIGKGKTPYRVGLSKRARIAPLLRIVKK
ncbi:uncharacterized protein CC84DRAFT_1212393 [Paraphaeosphaeria sporulosa]|uniref:UBA domain-containing protein n=1 Tax=Paraphaeosphaeria sporulosa TaxID=1460663 RepID=A0A177D110_9PLEO|nr:uncharacterized protein CC84DRAFT_1212393 [Paraphaeosphaeria sporulosa]OAG12907.1 hypothetical protein CC84DRAFT_1212393 [Paraphaeosphaeria sporulosa]